ncbi:MAG: PilZ domain-containing protein, partial [Desulfobacterales bacterium]
DISSDGLSFKYLGKELVAEAFSHIDIFLVDNRFYLHRMPCKIIYEAEDESFGKEILPQKFRCGVQFLGPATDQFAQLEEFMQNYATGGEA